MKLNKKGFTLVEVVIVLTVMALLAVAALPRIINIITQAKKGSRDNIVAAVREGIFLQKINTVSETNPLGSYPSSLDANTANACNVMAGGCFASVLEAGQQITDTRWEGLGSNNYEYDNGTSVGTAGGMWTYNSSNGTFTCTAYAGGSC